MNFDEKMIRAYLLRSVADCNKTLSGLLYSSVKSARHSYDSGFGEIIQGFAGSRFEEPLSIAYKDMELNPKKSYSVYHYFDIDTLIAYYQYLQNIIDGAFVRSGRSGRMVNSRDFKLSLEEAKSILKRDAYQENSGYYNPRQPAKFAKITVGEKDVLNPVKPMTPQAFAKKYKVSECEAELNKYIDFKHPSSPQEEVVDEEDDVSETFLYNLRGKFIPMAIISKDYFTDAEGRGVMTLKASAKQGMLIGTYYNNGQVYSGDLYNLDGELVESDAGGEYFYENKKESSRPTLDPKDFENSEQISMIDD